MHPAELGLGLLSGALSTLSPCVLPILPIVFATALRSHRFGGIALALGLILSFTTIGIFVATIGIGIGLDQSVFRVFSAALMGIFGIVLLVPFLADRFAELASRLTQGGGELTSRISGEGLRGQFLVGLILGAVWTPCVGPTLGAAATLAGSRQQLGEAAAIMAMFGLGASLPLALLGSASREAFTRMRGRLSRSAALGKKILGVLLLLTALGILTGLDRVLEAGFVSTAPDWLIRLTTKY